MSSCPQDNPHPAPREPSEPARPQAAPGFYLVKLPPEAVASATPTDMAYLARDARGNMLRVNQEAMLVGLLLEGPRYIQLAAQVINDPDNPKWRELMGRVTE